MENSNEEHKDRVKSALLSILIWVAILLFAFLYKLKPEFDIDSDKVTAMLVSFGDSRNKKKVEEDPAGQLHSKNVITEEVIEQRPTEMFVSETKTIVKSEFLSTPEEKKKRKEKKKIITGGNTKVSVPKKEKFKKIDKQEATSTNASKNNKKSDDVTTNSKIENGKIAVGNLIKARGIKSGTLGTRKGVGNVGDPLGGAGDGDSKVGVDRKLISYIPGTMGRGGIQPSHSCTASGFIIISYTVDKAGNVVSARRSGGISDPCISSISVAWVKTYVKAEKANTYSTGTYKIIF